MDCAGSGQQFFRTTPQDSFVAEGGRAIINCVIGDLAGRVQWTKDGLTLGKTTSPSQPGVVWSSPTILQDIIGNCLASDGTQCWGQTRAGCSIFKLITRVSLMKLCMSAKWVPMELISQLEPVQSSMFSVSISVCLVRARVTMLYCSASNQGRAGRSQVRLRAGGEGGGGGGAQVHHPQRQAQAGHHLVPRGPGVCTR